MQISSLLSPDRTLAKTQITSKKKATEMVAQVFAESISHIDADALLQSLITRERLGSTGLGNGIAIPHCRFDTGGDTYAACITLDNAIDYDSVDNQPVDLIFAMLVPENAEQSHLETLAYLADKFQSTSYAQDLRAAKDDDQLFKIAIN